MTQQINLLLPSLRRKFEWLAFPVVVMASIVVLFLTAALYGLGSYRAKELSLAALRSNQEVIALEEQIQILSQALTARQPSAALQAEIARLKELLEQRESALSGLEAGMFQGVDGLVMPMRGFAMQAMEGVWLTGVSYSGLDLEIRGRLTDPALLPKYIKRLNSEPAFQGRKFSALDMKIGELANGQVAVASSPGVLAGLGYTEFVLRGAFLGNGGKEQ